MTITRGGSFKVDLYVYPFPLFIFFAESRVYIFQLIDFVVCVVFNLRGGEGKHLGELQDGDDGVPSICLAPTARPPRRAWTRSTGRF